MIKTYQRESNQPAELISLPQRWQMIDGLPKNLYTAEQVRELDRKTISAGAAGIVLMNRAAKAVFEQVTLRWPTSVHWLIYCGAGNNGGDGYLIARLAIERGKEVTLVDIGDPLKRKGDAATARQAALDAGIIPLGIDSVSSEQCRQADIIVDAMLGTGLKGDVRPQYAKIIAQLNAADKTVVAVDIPSGICSDTGCVKGIEAVRAVLTVTFIGLKCGLFTADAVNHTGEIHYSSLGVSEEVLASVAPIATLAKLSELAAVIPRRDRSAYKNQSGHLLIIGGNYGMAGAPLLAAQAAMRCGAGLVSVATRPEHTAAIISRAPEIMAIGVDKISQLTSVIERASAIVIGPGLGVDPWAQQLLQQLLELTIPLVIDADALNLMAKNQYFEPASPTVITPHNGEAARLLGPNYSNAQVNADRFNCASSMLFLNRMANRKAVVLKGAGTLVASEHRIVVCPYGNPGMATAGMGDVLSGVIGAYLAQGLAIAKAAELGVCLHAAAADLSAFDAGQYGLQAGDIPASLRKLINSLIESVHPDAF